VDFNLAVADCFKTEVLDDKVDCETCQTRTKTTVTQRIKTLPRILIMQMLKFDAFGKKKEMKIEIPMSYSFDCEFFEDELKKKEKAGWVNSSNKGQRTRKHIYELYAFIVHKGKSSLAGHYYAMIRDKVDSKTWYKFDDENLSVIKD
jgi:uncharacterized UBP type Zn finger protein